MHRKRNRCYPHVWLSGPDPVDHRLYTDCQRARAQAKYRGESWTITEEQYIAIWRKDDQYLKKGRGPNDLCLTMCDPELGWHLDNVEIIDRLVHYKNQGLMRRQHRELV